MKKKLQKKIIVWFVVLLFLFTTGWSVLLYLTGPQEETQIDYSTIEETIETAETITTTGSLITGNVVTGAVETGTGN